MSQRPWYKRYGADFVHGCLGLTLEEKGAYSLCLDLIYDRGGPIPDDARWIAGVCGVSLRKWSALRARLLDAGKLVESGGRLSNTRAEKEIENAAKTSQKLSESGAKGGANRAKNASSSINNNAVDEGSLRHTCINQIPDTRSQIPEEQPPSLPSEVRSPTAAERGTFLKPDWAPSAAAMAFALTELGGHAEAGRALEKFRNYWLSKSGKDGRKRDWDRTWRNWVMAETDRGRPHGKRTDGSFSRPDRRPSGTDQAISALADAVARRTRGGFPPDDPGGFRFDRGPEDDGGNAGGAAGAAPRIGFGG